MLFFNQRTVTKAERPAARLKGPRENTAYSVNTTKMGVKTQEKFTVFLEAFPCKRSKNVYN